MQASASVTASGDSKAAIGEALKQALSGNRLQSISLHDERGDVLWLDEGALGPDEHNLVIEAAAALTAGPDRTYVFQSIGDGRSAAFLPARSPLNDLLGIAMIIADAKFLDSKGAAKFVTPTTTNLMRRLSFLRKPTAPAAPVTPPPASPPLATRVASPPPPARPAAPPPAGAARPGVPARPAAPAPQQRPAAPQAKAPPAAPARPAIPPKAPVAPPKAAQPAARPAAPPARPAAPPAKSAAQQRPSSSADSDSIAFEISDIDPKSLLKGATRAAQPEAKRPDLRVVQTDRLPRLELRLESDPIPELIQDEAPAREIALEPMYADGVSGEEETTEVEALAAADADADMNVEPEFVDEAPQFTAGAGQFEFYGQIFELHVQQLVKLKGSGGTRRFEVLVRDAHADNEFGVAPERVLQDVHDPSANSDLDRIVVEQLLTWLGDHRGVWETEPASFSVNVGMGTIADPKFASFVAASLKNHKVPAKAIGFEITEKSCVEQVRDVDMFIQACEKIGCHVVLDDFTLHHNALRWLGSSALKFLKLDPKITAIAMKERVPQALVVAIAQASKVLGLSCVAKRVDTPAVRDWLSAVGLDYAQGFLLDQPRSLTALAADPSRK
ncbi:MAG TPA: EAL domain-containing protein [Steroidobacteraceae bacterium]|nr:EAL domain-containing protein [Steroidobacteraceae bacterium]